MGIIYDPPTQYQIDTATDLMLQAGFMARDVYYIFGKDFDELDCAEMHWLITYLDSFNKGIMDYV